MAVLSLCKAFSRCFFTICKGDQQKDLASSDPKSGPEIQHGRIGRIVEGECQVFVDTEKVAVWNAELAMKLATWFRF